MTTAVVGAGPVGLVCALALAQRGERVLLLDPDPGPAQDGAWRRTGVRQFQLPHFFRPFVRQVLEQHVPSMWEAVLAAGAVLNQPPPGVPAWVTTLSSRRSTFEGALRRAARHERLTHVSTRVDRLLVERDRVVGVEARGSRYDADRVLVATGRSSRLGQDLRAPAEGSPCGQAYVSRMYRARPGAQPLTSFTPQGDHYDGYRAIAFPQDDRTMSALVVHASADDGWTPLRRDACFQAVVAQIPALAPWTHPDVAEPITGVLRGGTLHNTYQGQGHPPAGVLFVGDAVSTTNPSAGRGVSVGLLQAGALLDLLSGHDDDRDVSQAFDAYGEEQVRPWYEDHVVNDAALLQCYRGEDLDVDGPLPNDVVCSAAQELPELALPALLYDAMMAPPVSLAPHAGAVRALLRTGWRPRPAPGPSRDDLVERLALAPA